LIHGLLYPMKPDSYPPLIRSLQNPDIYPHPVQGFAIIQTHISWILLTGPYAYKIKKPLNLEFLDFSTLEKRHFFCLEELRLNRRLAEQMYLEVVPITGNPDNPRLKGTGPVMEYAVKMIEFPQEAQLDRILKKGDLHPTHIDALAKKLMDFHHKTKRAGEDSPFGSPERIAQPLQENFKTLFSHFSESQEMKRLQQIQEWVNKQHEKLTPFFMERKRSGFIRECHGDMHLGNMALINNQIVIFDCIEFNENLRWIDIMSELAFLTMDLEDRGYLHFAHRFLNAYIELNGDYQGLRLLRYFQVYRALVRAKVACIRLSQRGLTVKGKKNIEKELETYLGLADRFIKPTKTWVGITHGLSGSGKTTLTQSLIEATGAVRIRTDVERKRLFGFSSGDRTLSQMNTGIYSPQATLAVYQKLAEMAQTVVQTGFPVIIDGTFLKRYQRTTLHDITQQLGIPFIILNFTTSKETLRKRVIEREQEGRDASEANLDILKNQIESLDPLQESESCYTIDIKTDQTIPLEGIIKQIEEKIQNRTSNPIESGLETS